MILQLEPFENMHYISKYVLKGVWILQEYSLELNLARQAVVAN